ncbi:MAG TPA: c-type cytochrome [Steroidobacter sp.]|uniref:c-type cytochrome n=1 Tax=Steroidobacter sp. TaxID=1978227 RepID=UPI002ED909E1
MNKRQARVFAIASTALATVVFLGLTVHSHTQFDELTNAENNTPQVQSGRDVWHRYNCVNCHTLFGEGAYYAPDLTKITQLRGEQYLKAYMRDPSSFYDEQRHRRLMPRQDLSEQEIDDLIAFLDWVSKVDNQGWPPRPILVTGASIPGTDFGLPQTSDAGASASLPPGARPVSGQENPIALGAAAFRSVAPACNACHSTAPGVNMAGPSLAGVAARAEKIIQAPDYQGEARDVKGYLIESIRSPSAYIVPGPMYSANGQSFMPNTYAHDLSAEQIEQLAEFLQTLK